MVGATRSQGGVLVVVLISILWEGVYEGSLDTLWELVKEIDDHDKYVIILIWGGGLCYLWKLVW
jgi:hypothetical protein